MTHQGNQTKRKDNAVSGKMKIGAIVKIPSTNAGLSKGDNKKLTLVAIEVKSNSKELSLHKLSHRLFQM